MDGECSPPPAPAAPPLTNPTPSRNRCVSSFVILNMNQDPSATSGQRGDTPGSGDRAWMLKQVQHDDRGDVVGFRHAPGTGGQECFDAGESSYQVAKSIASSANALNTSALPDGSWMTLVACSPGW